MRSKIYHLFGAIRNKRDVTVNMNPINLYGSIGKAEYQVDSS